jgi:hypothetical protein
VFVNRSRSRLTLIPFIHLDQSRGFQFFSLAS